MQSSHRTPNFIIKFKILYLLLLACGVVVLSQTGPVDAYQNNDNNDDGNDPEECCPFERMRWDIQNGPWDPSGVIAGTWNPLDYRKNGEDPCNDPCIEPACFKAGIPGIFEHGYSYQPMGNYPESSGDDWIAAEKRIPGFYNLVFYNTQLLRGGRTFEIEACINSTAHRGNCANAGGSYKLGGEPDPPQVDACFDTDLMDMTRWEIVSDDCDDEDTDDDETPSRPQRLRAKVTLTEANPDLPKGVKELFYKTYDNRAIWQTLITVTCLESGDDGSDDGGPEGGERRYEGGNGFPGDGKDEFELEEGYDFPLVGLEHPMDTDRDALHDEAEIYGNGITVDFDNKTIGFNSPYRIILRDGDNEPHFPDPENPHTVEHVLDGLSDNECGFNEAYDPNWPRQHHQIIKGDGVNLVTEVAGFVDKYSPIDNRDEGSHKQRPLPQWEAVKRWKFESTDLQIPKEEQYKRYAGVKKSYLCFESDALLREVMPSFNVPFARRSMLENLGVFPILVLENQYWPSEFGLHANSIARKISADINWEDGLGRFAFSILGGSINFNNGEDYKHLSITFGDDHLQLDPDFSCVINHRFAPDHLGFKLKAATYHISERVPQLNDFLLVKEESQRKIGAVGLPILYNKRVYERLRTKIFEHQSQEVYDDMNTFNHENMHKYVNHKEHPLEKMVNGGFRDLKTFVGDQTLFDKEDLEGKYYQVHLDLESGDGQTWVGCWSLGEALKLVRIEEYQPGLYHGIGTDLGNLVNLHPFSGTGSGKGSRRDREESFRYMWNFVPSLYLVPNILGKLRLEEGRYWIFTVYLVPEDVSITEQSILYRRSNSLTLDMRSYSTFLEVDSLLRPWNVKPDWDLYAKVNMQWIEGPMGYKELILD